MEHFLIEQPIISGEGSPRRTLARQLANLIREQPRESSPDAPAPRGHIVGVYGSRGSGKTSFLFTLLQELRPEPGDGGASSTPLVLPTGKKTSCREAIFKPAETRSGDGLLLMLLDHLKQQYPAASHHPDGCAGEIIKEIQKVDVLAKATEPFLAYEKDVAPSSSRLTDRYVDLLTEAATTTLVLRRKFLDLLGICAPEPARLVLLIDDVDLQSHRALELLEILHLFLDHPRVFIVLAADKPLLLQAIDLELKRRDVHHAGLAAALLAKYVPYDWPLPVPNHRELGEELRGHLDVWWNADELNALLPVDEREAWHGSFEEGPPRAASEREALQAVQPKTYREIKKLINTLSAWKDRLAAGAADGPTGRGDLAFHDAIASRYGGAAGLGLLPGLAPPFLVLLAAVDVQWPDLGLLEALEFEPETLWESLDPDVIVAPSLRSLSSHSREGPVVAALCDSSRFSAERRGQARRALQHLAHVLRSWRSVSATADIAERFLFVSLHSNADALDTFRTLWSKRLSVEEAEGSHLDLRAYAQGGRPNGAQVGAARAYAEPILDRMLSSSGRLWLCAVAPLSLLTWLGFAVDQHRVVVAWNARDLRPLEVPPRLDPPNRGGLYEVCSLQWGSQAPGSQHAYLILDLLERSSPNDLEAFPSPPPEVADAREPSRCRLLYPAGTAFNFNDVEDILLDVLELLSELRDRGVTTLHLGLIMPNVVAFALGRQLRSRGLTIMLYEQLGASYERAIELR